jgi:hypothetical protein
MEALYLLRPHLEFVDPRNGSLTNDATRDDTYGTWLGNEPEPAPSVGLDMGDNPHGPATQLEAMVFTGGDEFAADIEMVSNFQPCCLFFRDEIHQWS